MQQNIEDKLLLAKLQDKIKICKNRNKIVNSEFLNLHQIKLIQSKLNELKIKNGIQKTVQIKSTQEFGTLLKKNQSDAITQQVNLNQNLTAPIKKGDTVGNIEFYLNDEEIGAVDVIADESVDKMSFWTAFLWILYGIIQ